MNDYINFRFISVSEYGRAFSRIYVEYFVNEIHNIEPRVNVFKLEESVYKYIIKNKNESDKKIYKGLSSIVINNYKKNNRGETDRVANKNIRKFIKEDIDYVSRVIDDYGL